MEMKAILLIMSVLAILFVNIIFGVLMFILVALFVKDWEMISTEVVFEDEAIHINDKRIDLSGGAEGCVCYSVGNIGFHTLEDAVRYCLHGEQKWTYLTTS